MAFSISLTAIISLISIISVPFIVFNLQELLEVMEIKGHFNDRNINENVFIVTLPVLIEC